MVGNRNLPSVTYSESTLLEDKKPQTTEGKAEAPGSRSGRGPVSEMQTLEGSHQNWDELAPNIFWFFYIICSRFSFLRESVWIGRTAPPKLYQGKGGQLLRQNCGAGSQKSRH